MTAASALARISLAIVLLTIGGFFFLDSASYGLASADPITGRARGCYTILEYWLGYLEPNGDIRMTQSLVSLGFVVIGLWAFVRTVVIYVTGLLRPITR